ncbi:MAG: transposase [Armatimonadota bacterium]|nr:transposase [Armatimonadota bacterium]MDR7402092.1 transposase [Armatimonadota bacterium]MDR7404557.1 transposase [Armatimonadota bacterium]MDR7437082.1 transposase [Armatimonadota bacterium]MDR7472427.1 transposase [Armatimonadota bacterium]
MARKPRVAPLHAFFHVGATATRGTALFADDVDREAFVASLRRYLPAFRARVHAFCLMSTHAHLVVEVSDVPLALLMQRVLQVYAQGLNRRHGTRGHVFTDRFWSQPCDRDAYLLEAVTYIHLNPVRAGLVSRPEDYPWSSHLLYLRPEVRGWVTTECLLGMLGASPERAAREYALLVEERLARPPAREFE